MWIIELFYSVQLTSLSKENKLLRWKLQKEHNTILQYNKSHDNKDVLSSKLDSADDDFAKTSSAKPSEISSEIIEASLCLSDPK